MTIAILGLFTTQPTFLDARNVFKQGTIILSQTVCLRTASHQLARSSTNIIQLLPFSKLVVNKSLNLACSCLQMEPYSREKL